MYLHNTNFYFKGLISLQLNGLETFEPLQFIEFEKLEYLTLSGQPYYNFRSLKKLIINEMNGGIKRITILLSYEEILKSRQKKMEIQRKNSYGFGRLKELA